MKRSSAYAKLILSSLALSLATLVFPACDSTAPKEANRQNPPATSSRQDPSMSFAGPCDIDVPKFCGHVERGPGLMMMCLKQHQAELSSACRDRLDYIRERTSRKTK